MTYPSSPVSSATSDSGSDVPGVFRVDALDLIDKFNLFRNHISILAQTFVSRETAALMRTDLEVSTIGDAVFTAALPSSIRQTLLINPSGAVSLTGTSALAIYLSCTKVTPIRLITNGVASPDVSLWAEKIVFNSMNLTALVLADLEGITDFTTATAVLNTSGVTSISMPVLKATAGLFTVYNCPLLTSLSLPTLDTAQGLTLDTLTSLTSVSFALLKYAQGGFSLTVCNALTAINFPELLISLATISFTSSTALATITFPKLQRTEVLNFSGVAVTSLSFPSLTLINGSTTFFNISFCSVLTSMSAPVLTIVRGLTFTSNPALTTVTLTTLTDVVEMDLQIQTHTLLTTISIPALINVGNRIVCSNNPALVTFSLPTTLKKVGGMVIDVQACALNQASVDNILVRAAALDGTAGTTLFTGGSVNVAGGTNATPSATGLAAKATLISRGCTVANN